MTLKEKLLSFEGRLRRRDYWLLSLGMGVVLLGLRVVVDELAHMSIKDPRLGLMGLLFAWPITAVMVKRLHDRGRSGWLAAIVWFPTLYRDLAAYWPLLFPLKFPFSAMETAISLWCLVYFGFLDGTSGFNKYGPSPKSFGGDIGGPIADEPALPA